MYDVLMSLHIAAAAIVVGILLVQSLALAVTPGGMSEAQRFALRRVQTAVHAWVYYPLLAVAVLSGLWLAQQEDAFASGHWLAWKCVAVVLLAGLGLLIGGAIHKARPSRAEARALVVGVLLVSAIIIWLAGWQPF